MSIGPGQHRIVLANLVMAEMGAQASSAWALRNKHRGSLGRCHAQRCLTGSPDMGAYGALCIAALYTRNLKIKQIHAQSQVGQQLSAVQCAQLALNCVITAKRLRAKLFQQ